jgi:hypothetical protein
MERGKNGGSEWGAFPQEMGKCAALSSFPHIIELCINNWKPCKPPTWMSSRRGGIPFQLSAVLSNKPDASMTFSFYFCKHQ